MERNEIASLKEGTDLDEIVQWFVGGFRKRYALI
jgi:hypothetical protein